MKALAMILTLILTQQVLASNSCFDTQAVKDLIKASEQLDKCFASDDNDCDIKDLTVEDQKSANSERLIPFDRTSGNGLLERATGVVSADFSSIKSRSASAQKISRCHIITSAHLLYGNGKIPVGSNEFSINFHSGQTCDSQVPFKNKTGAKMFFKMVNEVKGDFKCDRLDKYNNCEQRQFNGHSDLVILKLDKYDKNDKSFFTINTNSPSSHQVGQRVNCWGFPDYNENIKLPQAISDAVLWAQKDAQIFGDKQGQSYKGILTNAVAYKGMSGGGCVIASKPTELVGVFANQNSSNGKSAVDVRAETSSSSGANYLSGFHKLKQRYFEETGKSIDDLDKECD